MGPGPRFPWIQYWVLGEREDGECKPEDPSPPSLFRLQRTGHSALLSSHEESKRREAFSSTPPQTPVPTGLSRLQGLVAAASIANSGGARRRVGGVGPVQKAVVPRQVRAWWRPAVQGTQQGDSRILVHSRYACATGCSNAPKQNKTKA